MKFKNKILAIVLIAFIIINNIIPLTTNAVSCNLGEDINLTGYGSVPKGHVRNSESGDYAIETDLVRLL